MRIFCDLDSTLNDSYRRVRRFSFDGTCDWKKAYSEIELMKDIPNMKGKNFIEKYNKDYEVIIITARNFKYSKDFTKQWLDNNNFIYSKLIIVKNPLEKIKYLNNNDFLIDDFSQKHEIYDPYKVLNWKMIKYLNKKKKKYLIFKGDWDLAETAFKLYAEN